MTACGVSEGRIAPDVSGGAMFAKPERYYQAARRDLVLAMPNGPHRVLDVGCGMGQTGRALKDEGKAVEVVGLEKEADVAATAAAKLDRVLVVDVEKADLPLDDGYFDYIIMGDILEHLYDPWKTVSRLAQWLRQGGYMLASLPNVRYWRVLGDLVLRGQWRYRIEGVLDRTHIRFFTKRTMKGLFSSERFTVTRVMPGFQFYPASKSRFANRLTLGVFEEFLTRQYLIEAQKL